MTPLVVPKLSMSGEPVRLVGWLFEDGAHVERGAAVAELETEKSNIELEAPVSGILRIAVRVGSDVDVDAVIGHLLDDAEATADHDGLSHAGDAGATSSAAEVVDARPQHAGDELSPGGGSPALEAPSMSGRTAASPAARRLADEHAIDLTAIVGSGPGGRIVTADVEAEIAPSAKPTERVAGRREAVVAGISASWSQIPHVHIAGRLDAEGLVAAKSRSTAEVTYTDLLVLALTRAVSSVPELNGTFAGEARRVEAVHLSLAVATPEGVAAPTIRNAQTLGLAEIAVERRRLVVAAREGTLEKRELGNGTLTLSNLGALPVDFFAPVISGPQICLVATGRITQDPVAVDGMIALRHRIWINVAIDHRAADGEHGGRLLAALEREFGALEAQTEQGER